MEQDLNISGLKELNAFLAQLPVKLRRNVVRGALRAGIKLIYQDARTNCPVGQPSATGRRRYKLYEGALRDSIRISVKAKGSYVRASVLVGGKVKKTGVDVFYAHLIEFTGAGAHEIVARKYGSLFIGGLFRKAAHHPGISPHPFLRPAFDKNQSTAVIAAGNYMKNRLATKEGLDTADITIAEEE